MSIAYGSPVTSTNLNNNFASKNVNNTLAGKQTVLDTTQSTDKDTGSIVTDGGLGVEKNINSGGNISAVGTMSAGGNISGLNLSGSNSGDLTVGAVGSTPNANGLTLVGQVLNAEPANASNPGVVTTGAQELSGEKTFKNLKASEKISLVWSDDSTTTGIDATLANPTTTAVRLTNASLVSITMIDSVESGKLFVLANDTGADQVVKNEAGATATKRIITGTGDDLVWKSGSTLIFLYDNTEQRWRIVGGSGSGGGIFVDTLTNILAVADTEGFLGYATDLDQLVTNDGSEYNLVPKNDGDVDYLLLGNARIRNPFTGYADASAVPVDGTGGSPTATLAINSQKFRFTSGTLGDGFAYPFTIDPYHKSTVWTLELGSEHVSGTYTKGDLTVWLYDVTNSQLISPQPINDIDNFTGNQEFTFQLGAGTSYRFLIHQKTSATFVRDFKVSLKQKKFAGYAPITTDDESITPVFSQFGTVTAISVYKSQVGKDLFLRGNFTTGTVGGGTPYIEMPNGLKIDDTKLPSGVVSILGRVVRGIGAAGAGIYELYLCYDGSDNTKLYFTAPSNGGNPYTVITVASSFFASSEIQFISYAKIPVKGWSSESKVISEYDGRRVSASAYVTTGYTPSAGDYINFGTVVDDSHGCITTGTGTSWRYTAKVAGKYSVKVTGSVGAGALNTRLFKNGVVYSYLIQLDTGVPSGSREILLNVGDYISVEAETSVAVRGYDFSSIQMTAIDISLLSGAQQITAGEKYIVSYGASGTTAASTDISFSAKLLDTHDSWSGSLFTAIANGYYEIHAKILLGSSAGSNIRLNIYKNAGLFSAMSGFDNTPAGGSNITIQGTILIPLLAGETVSFQWAGGSAMAAFSGSDYGSMYIKRVSY